MRLKMNEVSEEALKAKGAHRLAVWAFFFVRIVYSFQRTFWLSIQKKKTFKCSELLLPFVIVANLFSYVG